ncbi:MAG TPA: hypothetical protein VE242_09280 [Chthoniobacterales bacterium]|nr:hypothetical protein [Chthoniobacterales bacterium]
MRTLLVCFFASALFAFSAEARPFHFPADTFAFSNYTYFDYHATPEGGLEIRRRPKDKIPEYSRHCFSMVRAALEFYQFAEFRPDLPQVSEAEYRHIIRRISRIPPWTSGPAKKIEVPGYPDLHTFSTYHRLVLQNCIGQWWPPYLRVGNWRTVFPALRSNQTHLANWLRSELDAGRVRPVFITRGFRVLNHCLVAYSYTAEPNGDLIFAVYDANQRDKLVHLRYQASDQTFQFDPTWYYPGGLVTAMKLYVSPIM